MRLVVGVVSILGVVFIAGCSEAENRSTPKDDAAAQLKAIRAVNSELTERLRAATAENETLARENKALAQQLKNARNETAAPTPVDRPSEPRVVASTADVVDQRPLTTAERITQAWVKLSSGPFEDRPLVSPKIGEVADDVAKYRGRCVEFNDVSVDARVELADGVYIVWLKDDRGILYGGADTIRLSLGKRMADDLRTEFSAGTFVKAKLHCLIGTVPQYIGDPSPAAWIYRFDALNKDGSLQMRFSADGMTRP